MRQMSTLKVALIRPSGTFSHGFATGEGAGAERAVTLLRGDRTTYAFSRPRA